MKRDMKEEIRDYKLVRWYPSLPINWDSTHSYQYNRKLNVMVNITLRDKKIAPYVQSMPLIEPDFIEYWKKNKPKPLFITEDGVEVFDKDFKFILVDYVFEKFYASYVELVKPLSTDIFKYFAHESNADEYIWRNKRVFSYEDVVEWYGYGFKLGREGIYETLERLAIERSK